MRQLTEGETTTAACAPTPPHNLMISLATGVTGPAEDSGSSGNSLKSMKCSAPEARQTAFLSAPVSDEGLIPWRKYERRKTKRRVEHDEGLTDGENAETLRHSKLDGCIDMMRRKGVIRKLYIVGHSREVTKATHRDDQALHRLLVRPPNSLRWCSSS